MKDDWQPIITTDGNQTLAVIERLRAFDDNPKNYPVLTGAHIMGGAATAATDTAVRVNIDTILPRDLRARAVGAAMFKRLRDADRILMCDLYLLGRRGYVEVMKSTMRPDSLASGLTDAELERGFEIYEFNMAEYLKQHKLRKRKDWRG